MKTITKFSSRMLLTSLLSTTLAFLVRYYVLGGPGSDSQYVTFYPAVMFASSFCGYICGLLTTFFSALLAVYFFIEPYNSFKISIGNDLFSLITFFVCASGMSVLGGYFTKYRSTLKKQSAYLQQINTELNKLTKAQLNKIKELETSEERFRDAIEKAPFPIMIHDENGFIITVNTVWLNLTGYTKKQLNTIFDWARLAYGTQSDKEIKNHIAKIFDLQKEEDEGEHNILCHNKTTRIWHLFSAPLGRWIGEKKTILNIAFDITKIKEAELKLTQSKQNAENANDAKTYFLANMSHEIRTPLSGVLGMLQLLKSTSITDEQNEYIKLATISIKRLTKLLSDILDITRVEKHILSLHVEPFTLHNLFNELLQLFKTTSKETSIMLASNISDNIPDRLLGDHYKLIQIFTNLIGNSFKFSEKGTISIEAYPLPLESPSKCKILFSVTDQGCGISDENLSSLFKPFCQVDSSYTKKYQGAGLGLSICKGLVELMGGNMSIDTEQDVGTTIYFCLTFNIDKTVNSKESIKQQNTTLTAQPSYTVLIVDDEEICLISLKMFLEKHGFTVFTATNGDNAIAILRDVSIDIVFMDIQLPETDGIKIMQTFRVSKEMKTKSNTPIIALTAYAMKGDQAKFIHFGFDDYLSKPIDYASVINLITKHTKKSDQDGANPS